MSLLSPSRRRKLLDPLHEIAFGPALRADHSVSAQPKFPAQHGRKSRDLAAARRLR